MSIVLLLVLYPVSGSYGNMQLKEGISNEKET
jgi:hypothetical protein